MAIYLKEYVGSKDTQIIWDYEDSNSNIKENKDLNLKESFRPSSGINVEIEGIHSIVTRNSTFYTDNAMKGSENLWVSPYFRPMILHHNEHNGKIIGRIYESKFGTSELVNSGCLKFKVNISDEEYIPQVKDGRLATTSIGVIVYEAECSICGQDLVNDGPCEHERGELYDGSLCYWIIERFEPKELSFVIVPSDKYSQIVKIEENNCNILFESQSGASNLNLKENVSSNKKEDNVLENNLQEQLKSMKQDFDNFKESFKNEKALKEAAEENLSKEKQVRVQSENENTTLRESLVNALVDNLCTLREGLNKPTDRDIYAKRSIEVLQSNIEDLKEELKEFNKAQAEAAEKQKELEQKESEQKQKEVENTFTQEPLQSSALSGKEDFEKDKEKEDKEPSKVIDCKEHLENFINNFEI